MRSSVKCPPGTAWHGVASTLLLPLRLCGVWSRIIWGVGTRLCSCGGWEGSGAYVGAFSRAGLALNSTLSCSRNLLTNPS